LGHVLSKTKSVTPHFFCLFGKSRSLPFCVLSFKKSVRGNILGANVFKASFLSTLHKKKIIFTAYLCSKLHLKLRYPLMPCSHERGLLRLLLTEVNCFVTKTHLLEELFTRNYISKVGRIQRKLSKCCNIVVRKLLENYKI